MELTALILPAILVVGALLALRFLAGIVSFAVSLALFGIAIWFLFFQG